MSQHAAILPDRECFEQLIAGKSPIGDGSFWLVNLLKFKSGGANEYREYERQIAPLLQKVGGKCIFRLYENVRTVLNGAGKIPDWDGVFIGSYPGPRAFYEFSTSAEYKAAHKFRAAALLMTEIYACDSFWVTDEIKAAQLDGSLKPNLSMDMEEPKKLAEEKQKDPEAMEAIMGTQESVMKFLGDKRFNNGRLWMLNLLKYEEGYRAKYYAEYGVRAQKKISEMKKSEDGVQGGIQLSTKAIFTLTKGTSFDSLAIMQYPGRDTFVEYMSGGHSGKEMKEGFILRQAGLAVQGLIALGPEADADAIQDEDGPRLTVAKKSRL